MVVGLDLARKDEGGMMSSRMYVVKRGKIVLQLVPKTANYQSYIYFTVDGKKEPVLFDKITSRISKLCYGLNQDFIDPVH